MKTHPAPIVTMSERLHVEVESAVSDFPRKHRHLLGADLRKWALDAFLAAQGAWRRNGDKAKQRDAITELISLNDRLKAGLTAAMELQAFTSFGRFEAIARVARDVGRQAGAWQRQVEKHLYGQNSVASQQPERPETLSTHAASRPEVTR